MPGATYLERWTLRHDGRGSADEAADRPEVKDKGFVYPYEETQFVDDMDETDVKKYSRGKLGKARQVSARS